MEIMAHYYIAGACTKSVLEDEDLNLTRRDVEEFLMEMLRCVNEGINNGYFDGYYAKFMRVDYTQDPDGRITIERIHLIHGVTPTNE